MFEYKVKLEPENHRPYIVKEKEIDYGETERMDNPKKIVDMMNVLYDMYELAEEHMYMITMNTKLDVTGVFMVGMGTVNQTMAGPREIFIRALLAGACSVALIHNHPSGDTEPSEMDRMIAKQLATGADILGITVTDFIVIGKNGLYYSMNSEEPWTLEPKEWR